MDQGSTYKQIYEIVKQIPSGKVATYGQIARIAGFPGHARLVGYAMHSLPNNSGIPWHRVINAKGQISFPKDSVENALQRSMLEAEGVVFNLNNSVSLKRFQWRN